MSIVSQSYSSFENSVATSPATSPLEKVRAARDEADGMPGDLSSEEGCGCGEGDKKQEERSGRRGVVLLEERCACGEGGRNQEERGERRVRMRVGAGRNELPEERKVEAESREEKQSVRIAAGVARRSTSRTSPGAFVAVPPRAETVVQPRSRPVRTVTTENNRVPHRRGVESYASYANGFQQSERLAVVDWLPDPHGSMHGVY